VKTIILLLSLIATTAFASKKVDLLADLQCNGVDKNGEKVHVHINGVSNKLSLGKKAYDLKKQTSDDGTTVLKAEHKSHEAVIELSSDNSKFKISVDGEDKIKGVCRDTLGASDDDDSEQGGYLGVFGRDGD